MSDIERQILIRGTSAIDYSFPLESVFHLRNSIETTNTNHLPHTTTDARRVTFFLQKLGVDTTNPQSFFDKPPEVQTQIKKGINRILKRNGR